MAELPTFLIDGRDVPMDKLRAFLARLSGQASAALLNTVDGAKPFATLAAAQAAPAVAAGTQARVFNDATATNNGLYVNKTGAVGGYVLDAVFYNAVASVLNPLVQRADDASAAAAAVAAALSGVPVGLPINGNENDINASTVPTPAVGGKFDIFIAKTNTGATFLTAGGLRRQVFNSGAVPVGAGSVVAGQIVSFELSDGGGFVLTRARPFTFDVVDSLAPVRPYLITSPWGATRKFLARGGGSSISVGQGGGAGDSPNDMFVTLFNARKRQGGYEAVSQIVGQPGTGTLDMEAQFANAPASPYPELFRTYVPGMNDCYFRLFVMQHSFPVILAGLKRMLLADAAAGRISLVWTSPHPHYGRVNLAEAMPSDKPKTYQTYKDAPVTPADVRAEFGPDTVLRDWTGSGILSPGCPTFAQYNAAIVALCRSIPTAICIDAAWTFFRYGVEPAYQQGGSAAIDALYYSTDQNHFSPAGYDAGYRRATIAAVDGILSGDVGERYYRGEVVVTTAMIDQATAQSQASRDKSQDWAEGAGAPGGVYTRSAKAWADDARQTRATFPNYFKGERGDDGVGVPSVPVSDGPSSAGKGALLNSLGIIDASLLVGTKGYFNIPQVVFGRGNYPPSSDNGNGTVSTKAPVQGVSGVPDNANEYDVFAAQFTQYGNANYGWQTIYARTPGTSPTDFSIPVRGGMAVKQDFYQASTGSGQCGHVASFEVRVDGALKPGTSGEVAGRFIFSTGTGFAAANRPDYFGVQNAFVLNAKQQAFFPGQVYAKQRIAGQNSSFGWGSDFGGIIRVGPGGTLPGEAPWKNDIRFTSLLAVTEPGAVEYDTNNDEYRTDAAGVRRRVLLVAAPPLSWGTFTANTNATRTFRSGPDWLEITVVVGGADITTGTAARLDLSVAPDVMPVIASFSTTWSDPGAIPGQFRPSFNTTKTSLTISVPSGKMTAGETYTFTMLFR